MHADESFAEEVLNRLTAIRAAAEILGDNNLPRRDRDIFLTVIRTETRLLNQLIAG